MNDIVSLSKRVEALRTYCEQRSLLHNLLCEIVQDLHSQDVDWFNALVRLLLTIHPEGRELVNLPVIKYAAWRWFGRGVETVPERLTLVVYDLVERAARADPTKGDHTRRFCLPAYLVDAIRYEGLALDRECEDCGMLLPARWTTEDERESFDVCPECFGRAGKDLYIKRHV